MNNNVKYSQQMIYSIAVVYYTHFIVLLVALKNPSNPSSHKKSKYLFNTYTKLMWIEEKNAL